MQTPDFSAVELEQYARQIRIPGFGLAAQKRLKAAKVLITRVGGVGGTVAMRLAQAGVGHLILAHGGLVTLEYLNRWPLIVAADVGRPCIEVFWERLHAMNPQIELSGEAMNINEANAARLIGQADLIVDAAPLFEERYLLNYHAVHQRKLLVMAAMYSTEGYVTTMQPGETPCLACLYASKPDYWNSIQSFPVLGPVSDMVGAIAAMEAIKVITGFGVPLKGLLWHIDLQTNDMAQLQIRRRLDCAICSAITPIPS